jgi:DNA-binding CsgD family transcriptional regulator/tetratricopeptide (TPR) repeat protein
MLVGRGNEQRRIDALLDAAREGMSAALVLVGEPGIGKTALLEQAAASAAGFRILRARGVQSEAELAFAALLELCRPILNRLERLEPRQEEALRATFGLSEEQGATPFAIGAATLSLLAAAAEERPLLLLVDDAHWLDPGSADALAFAVRRLRADAVAALFATRAGEGRPFSGRELPELELERLDASAAATLLAGAREELDAAERARVLDLAHGNPLALLELPRHPDMADAHPEPLRVGKQLEQAFRARADTLPEPTRRALVVAAAASTSELGVLRTALARLELSLETLEPAEAAGLVSLDAAVLAFRHPLVRSALYHAADPAERRRAHAALAAAFGEDDRGAWHLAAAAVGPDVQAAAALERAADTATRRSGFAAAAAAYERAARLSERREDRLRRLSAAADSAWLAGRTAHALALIEEALAHARDDARRGELLHLRGTIEHFAGDPARAAATLEEAAALLAGSNRRLACLSLTQANGSLLALGEVARAVVLSERLLEIGDPDQPDEYLLTSLSRGAVLLMDGQPEEGLPFLRRAAAAIAEQELLSSDPRNLPWAALTAFWLGDVQSMASYAAAAARWAREHAAVTTLAFAARLLARAQLITGEWRTARASLAESLDSARISGQMNQQVETLGTLAWLDAAQGQAEECRRNVEEARALADSVSLRWRNDLLRALVLLELGVGLVEPSPLERLRGALGDPPLLRDTPANATAPEFVEALVRAGDADAATELLAAFADEAERVGQAFPQAVALRCRGLLADEDSYEREFERSLELHALDKDIFATARTRLAYGERLRRSGRRVDAREQLKQARGVFEGLEAVPWAERARSELRATGERVRARGPATSEELTPQELQVSMLVVDGRTNREVGAQLFLSPKTIEWHLGHVYRKLGIGSRAELTRILGAQQAVSAGPPAQTEVG